MEAIPLFCPSLDRTQAQHGTQGENDEDDEPDKQAHDCDRGGWALKQRYQWRERVQEHPQADGDEVAEVAKDIIPESFKHLNLDALVRD